MNIKPTVEQTLILETVRGTTENLQVVARAGAAKTTTLCLIAEAVAPLPCLCLAFNKKIAVELQTRLPESATAQTLHSLGNTALKAFFGKWPKVDKKKTYFLLKAEIEMLDPEDRDEAFAEMSAIIKMVSHAKNEGYLPEGVNKLAKPLCSEGDLRASFEEEPTDLQFFLIREVIRKSFLRGMEGTIDYDDMIYMPALLPVSFPRYSLTMVDEAQDLSILNHIILKKLVKNQRLIAVGDPCQPDGTLVTRVLAPGNRWHEPKLEQVPIEEILIGDTVLGYNGEGAFLYNRRVEGITRKPFDGLLVSVVGTGVESRYTPNHHCYVNFNSLRNKHGLYLMQRGSSFRMGVCKMDYGDMGSGPIVRAKHEGADAVWLLEVFDTQQLALLYEAFYQAKFGIPDLTFSEPSGNISRGFLDGFWSMCESLDLESKARTCLEHFGRDYTYPLWEKGQPYVSLKRPFVTQACNLISGCLMLPYTGQAKIAKDAWIEIDVGRAPYSGFVTSFTISDNHLYVADNLVTHNCQAIYAFRGAHESSMSELKETFKMKELFLTVCFRSSEAVVKNARWRAPDMQWGPTPPAGRVEILEKWGPGLLQPGDSIICRNNAPLFRMALELLRNDMHPEMFSGDIVGDLSKIIKKLGKPTASSAEAQSALDEWRDAQEKKTRSASVLRDKYECLLLFLERAPTLGAAIVLLDNITSMAGTIKLMTGHKSKGLEFHRVFFLDQHLCKKEGQDRNVKYVIETRAKNDLFYVTSETFGAV